MSLICVSGNGWCKHRDRRAFTLIEMLVVVAIIGLLIAVLLPSLANAREQGKRAVCLSNLRQMGVGFSGYSSDSKGKLPWKGSFPYTLMEGIYYMPEYEGDDWIQVNYAVLYPRYIGREPKIFYCPSNTQFNADDPEHGMAVFLRHYKNPSPDDPDYLNAHYHPYAPYGAYFYAPPAYTGRFPRASGRRMYSSEVVRIPETELRRESIYWQYLNDPAEQSFLGVFSLGRRGKQPVQALMSDAYCAETEGYHLGGYNVMFGDFHARWIRDPNHRIHNEGIPVPRDWKNYQGWEQEGKYFVVWDFFSRQP
ncbi:MAG: prepilin-type N-terminal cleavage/methylation domain-containing protein [Alphaproteobacteria bacterium]